MKRRESRRLPLRRKQLFVPWRKYKIIMLWKGSWYCSRPPTATAAATDSLFMSWCRCRCRGGGGTVVFVAGGWRTRERELSRQYISTDSLFFHVALIWREIPYLDFHVALVLRVALIWPGYWNARRWINEAVSLFDRKRITYFFWSFGWTISVVPGRCDLDHLFFLNIRFLSRFYQFFGVFVDIYPRNIFVLEFRCQIFWDSKRISYKISVDEFFPKQKT
jgi:hypothetical protein